MKATFIVPVYNGLRLTQEMLASLQATLPPVLEHEIILVDDGSTDGTRDWLASLRPPCRFLLNERNLGFAGACNRAATTASGELLFFLNNDLVLLPGWYEPIVGAFAVEPRPGIVGNVQLNAATGAVDHAGVGFNAKGKPEHFTRLPWRRGTRNVPAVTGACLALRCDLWRQLGGFDDGFVNGGEDIDLCLRAAAAGFPTRVALGSVVRHHVSASVGRKARDEQNSARLFRRWRAAITGHTFRPLARACLAACLDDPANFVEPALARDCLAYLLHLIPHPTRRIRAATTMALDLEQARWDALAGVAPAREPREVAPWLFPRSPAGPPTY